MKEVSSENINKIPYEKPVVERMTGTGFAVEIITGRGKERLVCKQCSSCHGCR